MEVLAQEAKAAERGISTLLQLWSTSKLSTSTRMVRVGLD